MNYASFALALCYLQRVFTFISWVALSPASGVSSHTLAARLSAEASGETLWTFLEAFSTWLPLLPLTLATLASPDSQLSPQLREITGTCLGALLCPTAWKPSFRAGATGCPPPQSRFASRLSRIAILYYPISRVFQTLVSYTLSLFPVISGKRVNLVLVILSCLPCVSNPCLKAKPTRFKCLSFRASSLI